MQLTKRLYEFSLQDFKLLSWHKLLLFSRTRLSKQLCVTILKEECYTEIGAKAITVPLINSVIELFIVIIFK